MFNQKIREQINIPLFLTGGLNPDNVREAIDVVQSFGVDICSGVRTNEKLDEKKLEAFLEWLMVRKIKSLPKF